MDFTLRDLPEEIMAQIDLRAGNARLSRQKYMVAHLTKTFGKANTITGQIATRLCGVFDEIADMSFGFAAPKPSIPTIAEMLGHRDPSLLESILSGDTPLAFADAEPLCRLLGINKTWLLNGDSTPFSQGAMFRDGMLCAQALANESLKPSMGTKYSTWYIVLVDGTDGEAAIWGQSEQDPFRIDLILSGVPLFAGVGAGGRSAIISFVFLCAMIDPTMSFNRGELLKPNFRSWGRLVSKETHSALINGTKHPGSILPSSYGHVPWYEDLWDFEQAKDYSIGYAEAKKIFQSEVVQRNITNNAQLHAYLKETILRWKQVAL
jgi:hypothetical protein